MPADPEERIVDLAKTFKLLADETRLRILFYLTRNDELHVRALCDLLDQSQPAVSHHLALLRVAGLIRPRREGKHNYYRLQPQKFRETMDTFAATLPKDGRGEATTRRAPAGRSPEGESSRVESSRLATCGT